MIGFIVFFVVMTAIAAVGIKAGQWAANKAVGYKAIGTRITASRLASVLCPVVAFVVFSAVVAIVVPAPREFTTQNVAWNTQKSGMVGNAANAVLVRTTGATVQPGILYSTATLRGQRWTAVPGGQWVNGGLAYVVIAYSVTAVVVGGFTAALAVLLAHGRAWVLKGAEAIVATAKPAVVTAAEPAVG